jgi:glycosyltransferase involved in cell wall biosynthesis
VTESATPVPLVSVVIPTYKRPGFLTEGLDSVFAQTFTDFEVIVVEDGSREARPVLEPYGNRVRYHWQPNQGVSVARNTGARLARGSWLAFLDDDDLWLPGKLAAQLALTKREPALGIVHTDRYILENGKLRRTLRAERGERLPSGWVNRELFFENFILTSSVLFRHELFERLGGFDPALSYGEDYKLWLRAAFECPIGFVDEPLVTYRIHGGGLSDDELRMKPQGLAILEGLLRERPALYSEYGSGRVRARLHLDHLKCAYVQARAEQYRDARGHFFAAWRWNPMDVKALVYAAACATGPRVMRSLRALQRRLRARNPSDAS